MAKYEFPLIYNIVVDINERDTTGPESATNVLRL